MKRLILLAAVVGLIATGCEKTEIQNEVLTPISFSSNVGKQTKAIAQTTAYNDAQFGVFSYGHQPAYNNNIAKNNKIMDNVCIGKIASGENAGKWAATEGEGAYYWPNNDNTTIDFYAYSPYFASGIVHREEANGNDAAGLYLTGYVHNDQTLDFMVSTPAKGKTYSNTYVAASGNTPENPKGTVQITFNHQLTQLNFTVATTQAFDGPIFTVKSITLSGIYDKGNYSNSSVSATWATGSWSNHAIDDTHKGNYTVFTGETAVTNTNKLTPSAMTVIPQNLKNGSNVGAQKLTIVYEITGTGIAHETVTKEILFGSLTGLTSWNPNQKITYAITIGLNEIYFAPSVADWDEYDYDANTNNGIQNYPVEIIY